MKILRKSAKGVSLAILRRLWSEYNELVFGGRLSLPVLRITRGRRYFGKSVVRESDGGKAIVLLISGPCNTELADLRDTLLHEMIHQWQYENGLKLNEHDETFTQWLPKIKEITGIELQNTWDDGVGCVG